MDDTIQSECTAQTSYTTPSPQATTQIDDAPQYIEARLGQTERIPQNQHSHCSLAPSAFSFSSASGLASVFGATDFSGLSSTAGSGLVCERFTVAGVSLTSDPCLYASASPDDEGPAGWGPDPGGGATAAIRAVCSGAPSWV